MSRHQVVATKAMTQTLSHLVKIAYFGGILAAEGTHVSPGFALLIIAVSFVGTTLSRTVLERMTDNSFRRWTRWTVMSVGVMYLLGGLRAFTGP